jgi:hypothetical protein
MTSGSPRSSRGRVSAFVKVYVHPDDVHAQSVLRIRDPTPKIYLLPLDSSGVARSMSERAPGKYSESTTEGQPAEKSGISDGRGFLTQKLF